MDNYSDELLQSNERFCKIEKENNDLKSEVSRLQSCYQDILLEQENLLQIKKLYEERDECFKTIFEISKLGNKILTQDLKIIKVNQAFVSLLGYDTKEEVIGTKILDYAHQDCKEQWTLLQKKLWANEIPVFNFEACIHKKNGSIIWCNITSILFPDRGATLGYTIIEDITERKLLQEKIKELNRAQESMVYTIAHDLKTPIDTVKSLTAILKNELDAKHYDDTQPFIGMLNEVCNKAYSLIHDLLIIGELEAAEVLLSKQLTDIKKFIESQLDYFRILTTRKGIELLTCFSKEEILIDIDQAKFARVLNNLISNAIKFTNTGGEVNISVLRNNQKVVIKISDNGIGIPEEIRANIFDKFTTSKRKGTHGESTTGLGLYIVKQVVDLHKGCIWFENNHYKGTSFYIEL